MPSGWTQENPPPDVASSADHIDSKGRLCFTPKALAQALYAFEKCKLEMKLADDRIGDREDAISHACNMKVEAMDTWCSGQMDLVQTAYAKQVQTAMGHCDVLVKNITDNYSEQVKLAADMAPKHVKPKFWKTAEFWGPMAAVIGVTAGVFIGIGVSRLKL